MYPKMSCAKTQENTITDPNTNTGLSVTSTPCVSLHNKSPLHQPMMKTRFERRIHGLKEFIERSKPWNSPPSVAVKLPPILTPHPMLGAGPFCA
jgi:hypothetical protein